MRKGVGVKRFGWSKLIAFVVLVVIIWVIWLSFFNYEDCRDSACFDRNLVDCDKARFVGGDEMIFEYIIEGKSGGKCEVRVELLQGEFDAVESAKLEGQAMTCFLPLGAVVSPESDIGVCHGALKEGLQDLIIKKLHTYLVQNLGKLNFELLDIPSI